MYHPRFTTTSRSHFPVRCRAELDTALPLRKLSPLDLVTDDHLDFCAAQRVPVQAGRTSLFQFIAWCHSQFLRYVRLAIDLRERAHP